MSVLSRQKDESAAIVENTIIPLIEGAGNKTRGKLTAAPLQNSPSLPRVREEKVLAIKQQLAKGTYNLDKRLDAAVDRLLEAVTTWNNAAGRSCRTVSPLTIGLSVEQDAGW